LVLLLVEGGSRTLELGPPERPHCIGIARLRDERLGGLDRLIVLARREQLVDPHQCGGIRGYLGHRAVSPFHSCVSYRAPFPLNRPKRKGDWTYAFSVMAGGEVD